MNIILIEQYLSLDSHHL